MIHTMVSRRRSGFLLMEALLGIAVFALFASAVGITLLYGQENTIMSGDRIRATYHTEKALEAARSIRDASFSSVAAGQHGVYVNPLGKWAFTGSSVVASGGYVTSVTVSTVGTDWLRLSAQTQWKHGYNRSGSVLITSEITNWRAAKTVGNWSSISVEGTYTDAGTPLFNGLAVWSGSYAFLTSPTSIGLTVVDIRIPTAPVQVNTSFSLGVNAYDVAIRGSVLYVATSDSSQEIRAYDIASPTTFSAADLLGTYNVQGSSRARALAIAGDTLYVGTTASAGVGEEEFYALRITPSGGFTLLDTVNDDSSNIETIALSGTAAYLASSMDASELRVVNVESGSNIVLLGGYNLSDRTSDALAIAVSGTSAIIGTVKGSGIEEAVLFDVENGGIPTPPPGPWYKEGSGSIVGVAMDATRCYGFLSAQSGRKAFQVFNMRNKSTLTELATYDSTTGLGRGLMYDHQKDRVYMMTDRSLLIFKPATATGTCP